MNTIKISVKSSNDANLLIRLLHSLNFVESVEKVIDEEQHKEKGQFNVLQEIFAKIKKDKLFQSIDDPVNWQKSIRDEWS